MGFNGLTFVAQEAEKYQRERTLREMNELEEFLEAVTTEEERRKLRFNRNTAVFEQKADDADTGRTASWSWRVDENTRAIMWDNGNVHDWMFELLVIHESDTDLEGRPQFKVSMHLRQSRLNDAPLSSYSVNFNGGGRFAYAACSPENNNQFQLLCDPAGRKELKDRFPGILTCRPTRAESMAVAVREFVFNNCP